MLKMMAPNHFTIDITDDDSVINDANLQVQVFVQCRKRF